jgi:maleylpyruvate isomerase
LNVSDVLGGAKRPASEIVADLAGAQHRLEQVWDRSAAAGWPHPELRGDEKWATVESPLRRLGEVEIHHVDLGLGYEPSDWPEAYVAWQLPVLLATVPGRLGSPEDARRLLTWLAGRGSGPSVIELLPW